MTAEEWSVWMDLWQFSKHLAFAGLGPSPGSYTLIRRLAQLADFIQYWDHPRGCFKLPPIVEDDPTERNYVSHRVGKAVADLCAKQISKARFTLCYESAMRQQGFSIRGKRPDFYCDTLTRQFAVEAKGFARESVTEEAMRKHKEQANEGPLPVHFTKASVAYDLYSRPKVKYYDPKGEADYDEEFNRKLRVSYYEEILKTLDHVPIAKKQSIEGEDYVTFDFHPVFFDGKVFVHRRILERDWTSFDWLSSLPNKGVSEEGFFIDADGIGIGSSSEKPSNFPLH